MRSLALIAGGSAGLALVLAQLVLPGSPRTGSPRGSGATARCTRLVSRAWPAVELLWGDADGRRHAPGASPLSPRRRGAAVGSARGRTSMDVTRLSDQRWGSLELHGRAACESAAIAQRRCARPLQHSAAPRCPPACRRVAARQPRRAGRSPRRRRPVRRQRTAVDARSRSSEGNLVAHPPGFLSKACQLTLFSDAHVHIESIGARRPARRPTTSPEYRSCRAESAGPGPGDARSSRAASSALAPRRALGDDHRQPVAGPIVGIWRIVSVNLRGALSVQRARISVAIARISSCPKRIPMHVREPPPNGT